MLKSLATLIGALAISALLAPAAWAGASASAPSKYTRVTQPAASTHFVRQAKQINTPDTDVSASARTAPFHR
ncbi:hypothetical protein [Bradyrhizobium septentrionale]|uniref:Uncharacterized protein n=1 Tax=Bradyrhizobium septentrionale TaxID=1404411 RepID=A0A973W1N6_9BRAD|nr:hypothetical protein [Bradyrhizobium septentrionale]UGY14288.1 hypothetical protein HAP48_0037905 [Bradyrhizobium septentrionale]UGY23010.1 hypothetical protein HU675_0034355 [Bradyrhizobium septentrionale]